MDISEEKDIDRPSLISAVVLTCLLVLLFWWLKVWTAPDPPIPVYGVELNYGTSKTGGGKRQPQTPVKPTPVKEETVEEAPQEDVSEPVEQPVEEVVEPVEQPVEDAPVEEAPTETETETTAEPVDSDTPAPTEELKKPEKPAVVDDVKKAEKPKKKPVLFPGKSDSKKPSTGHGDDAKDNSDKGVETGKKNDKKPILYNGASGKGGDKPTLEMTGWRWDAVPRPQDKTEESGKIVFRIKIDDRGEIVEVVTLEKSVSTSLEQVYKTAVFNLTFSPKASNVRPAPFTTGKITFVIKSN
ncbi:hypothetical protein FUAX_16970 [Fulvitalea axinellae]|uniref:Uncharacterized protein n=1 Tax=Fulvitalea axinellae TaxID=1182444 RepID=A0AAU9DEB7_9BACT|nr:hypothetical protein FUAX_16970 [Fulvitalea axinellae]